MKRRIAKRKRGTASWERMSTWIEGVDSLIPWCCSLLHPSKTQRKEGRGEEIKKEKERKLKEKEKMKACRYEFNISQFPRENLQKKSTGCSPLFISVSSLMPSFCNLPSPLTSSVSYPRPLLDPTNECMMLPPWCLYATCAPSVRRR